MKVDPEISLFTAEFGAFHEDVGLVSAAFHEVHAWRPAGILDDEGDGEQILMILRACVEEIAFGTVDAAVERRFCRARNGVCAEGEGDSACACVVDVAVGRSELAGRADAVVFSSTVVQTSGAVLVVGRAADLVTAEDAVLGTFSTDSATRSQ